MEVNFPHMPERYHRRERLRYRPTFSVWVTARRLAAEAVALNKTLGDPTKAAKRE
jgi:hypothetical protein